MQEQLQRVRRLCRGPVGKCLLVLGCLWLGSGLIAGLTDTPELNEKLVHTGPENVFLAISLPFYASYRFVVNIPQIISTLCEWTINFLDWAWSKLIWGLKTLFDWIGRSLVWLWENIVYPILDACLRVIRWLCSFVKNALWTVWSWIETFELWLREKFLALMSFLWGHLKAFLSWLWELPVRIYNFLKKALLKLHEWWLVICEVVLDFYYVYIWDGLFYPLRWLCWKCWSSIVAGWNKLCDFAAASWAKLCELWLRVSSFVTAQWNRLSDFCSNAYEAACVKMAKLWHRMEELANHQWTALQNLWERLSFSQPLKANATQGEEPSETLKQEARDPEVNLNSEL